LNFYPKELYRRMWDQLIEDFFDRNKGISCPEFRVEEGKLGSDISLPHINICPH